MSLHIHEAASKPSRPPKPKPKNPIEVAITSWFSQLPPEILDSTLNRLISTAPKRWVVYPPMVLLPSGSFDEDWWLPLKDVSQDRVVFWTLILQHISKREGKGTLTHLAINSGIPLNQTPNPSSSENILRTPSGLIMLHGDFGPALSPDHPPSPLDFKAAFWVSTRQNGITQIWAPRYTMFSRGNIKEKARILSFHEGGKGEAIGEKVMDRDELKLKTAVDLYAGIGYFVFSYVAMGVKRIIGWELNPWSVEGLRRGALANGWSIKVIKPTEETVVEDEKIVVFLEDNMKAVTRREDLKLDGVFHVNCGLLPASEDSWEIALSFLDGRGWLHLHENVGVNDIETRRGEIEAKFSNWLSKANEERKATVEHVELVKTFAPGVWHCVFDVYLGFKELAGST